MGTQERVKVRPQIKRGGNNDFGVGSGGMQETISAEDIKERLNRNITELDGMIMQMERERHSKDDCVC